MIRIAAEPDIPAILDIYSPYVLQTTHSFEYTVPTLEEFTQRFRHHTHNCPWLVWEENGRILGYAYGAPAFERAAYAWCAEVSVYLLPEAQSRGIGRGLYCLLEELLFGQGYRVLYAIITSENTGSIAFHRALGYRLTAELPGCGYKFGRKLGTVWMEKNANFVDIPTKPPAKWCDIVKNDGILQNILANLSLS